MKQNFLCLIIVVMFVKPVYALQELTDHADEYDLMMLIQHEDDDNYGNITYATDSSYIFSLPDTSQINDFIYNVERKRLIDNIIGSSIQFDDEYEHHLRSTIISWLQLTPDEFEKSFNVIHHIVHNNEYQHLPELDLAFIRVENFVRNFIKHPFESDYAQNAIKYHAQSWCLCVNVIHLYF